MKIGVFLSWYTVSGVPLAQIKLARALARAGHQVDLLVGYVPPGLAVPDIAGVTVSLLGQKKARNLLRALHRYFRSSRPDVVFSAEDHLNALTLAAAILARSDARISVSSHVSPVSTYPPVPFTAYSSVPFTKKWLLKQAMRAVGWRADAQTCVSQAMVEQYRTVFRNAPHVVVHNIVDDPEARAALGQPVDDPWFGKRDFSLIVAAGSLEPWKGFDDLIRAVAELHRRGREVRLVILGEGSRRKELEDLVTQLGLRAFVRLPGRVSNPGKYFARADAFVLSSHVEGLPTVLVEAMVAGCTPVATDCPTGPREVLQDGRYGYLAPVRDPAALADGIMQALDKPMTPARLEEGVRPFGAGAILDRHFALLGLRSADAAA